MPLRRRIVGIVASQISDYRKYIKMVWTCWM